MSTRFVPEKVHLVGSIGLDTVEEVFRTVGATLGRRVRRIPDGEPGSRRLWISYQYPLFRANPYLKVGADAPQRSSVGFRALTLADGVKPEDVRFGELGYAREARTSYQDFLAARSRGEVPAHARFQVCLPTPMAVVYAWCAPDALAAVEPAYERAMLAELATICRTIPQRDLAIQWDVCIEMIIWDGQSKMYPATKDDDILARLVRLGAAVPRDVELGFHLCYGDLDGRHFVEPVDAKRMVELANGIAAKVPRRIDFIHMPVPISRTDDAFFAPLASLQLGPGTELYLGMVHAADGEAGLAKRLQAACKCVTGFGIATECGMARARKPSLVREILQLHAAGSREPA